MHDSVEGLKGGKLVLEDAIHVFMRYSIRTHPNAIHFKLLKHV
jgi:hypothetical protein